MPSIGPVRFKKLATVFGGLAAAWRAPMAAFEQAGFEPAVTAEIVRLRQEINPEREMEKLAAEQVSVARPDDDDYPKLLKEIYSPPALLFYRGVLPKPDSFTVAIVGTRKCTPYGQMITERIAGDLARNNITIISGLAFGIDSIAHRATLDAGGITLAVLGCGIERSNVYPTRNRYLAEQIIGRGGCVLSEYPLGTPAWKSNFPQRNRIISGLSLGTLVVEAPIRSGALITAANALEQNREVFAVPGNVTNPAAEGANNLIKMGARLVMSATDILDALNLKQAVEFTTAREIVPEGPEEEKILVHLAGEPVHVDELVNLTDLPIQIINTTLALMEMKGKIKHLGSMKYVRAR